MRYSFNRDKKDLVFAYRKDINASFKDLSIVCSAIRYKTAASAVKELEEVESGAKPVFYPRFNKGMGSRHELLGKKGRWPKKCSKIVRNVLLSAISNAENKGYDPDAMVVVHASANKTNIVRRVAPKGILYISGGYGYAKQRRSDLELAKVEIGLGTGEEQGISKKMKAAIKLNAKNTPKQSIKDTDSKKKQSVKQQVKAIEKKAIADIEKVPQKQDAKSDAATAAAAKAENLDNAKSKQPAMLEQEKQETALPKK
jgi:ribosomal protein L22